MSEEESQFDWLDYQPIWCLCCDGEMVPVFLPEDSERMPFQDHEIIEEEDDETEQEENELTEEPETELEEYYRCTMCGWTIYAIEYESYKINPAILPCG